MRRVATRRRQFWSAAALAGLVAGLVASGFGCGPETQDGAPPSEIGATVEHEDAIVGDHRAGTVVRFEGDERFDDDRIARLEPGASFRQVGLMLRAEDLGDMEIRVRRDGQWGEWEPVEPYFSQGALHNAHVVLDEAAEAIEWRTETAIDSARVEFFERAVARTDLVSAPDRSERHTTEEGDEDVETLRQAVAPDNLVTSREEWGAIDPDKICNDVVEPFRMTLHHTYSPSDDGDDPAERMQQMQSYHINSNNWCDIGYHFVVAQSGEIFQGRSRSDRPGAHVGGENEGNVGIAMIGDYTTTSPPDIQLDGVVDMFVWVHEEHDVDLETDAVKGHRQWPGQSTSCPGDEGLAELEGLLDDAEAQAAKGSDDDSDGGSDDSGDDDSDDDSDDSGDDDSDDGADDGDSDGDDGSGLPEDDRNVDVNTGCDCSVAGGSSTIPTSWLLMLVVLGALGVKNAGRRFVDRHRAGGPQTGGK